jgi:hypothetical protein
MSLKSLAKKTAKKAGKAALNKAAPVYKTVKRNVNTGAKNSIPGYSGFAKTLKELKRGKK